MARSKSKRCRCSATMKLVDGAWRCPYGCPEKVQNAGRRHMAVGRKPERGPMLSREESSAGCRSAGTLLKYVSAPITEKAAKESYARRAGRCR